MTSHKAWSAALIGVALALGPAGCAAKRAADAAPKAPSSSKRPAPPKAPEAERGVPVQPDDPTWGSPSAPVTVVAFMDLECAFCAEAQATLSELEKLYDANDLRFVFKHHPLPSHGGALHAALAAQSVYEAAGTHAFRAFIARLFENQRSLEIANLLDWAEDVGVAREEVQSGFAAARIRRHVLDDVRLALRLGATGTPAFRINGVPVRGAMPIEAFQDIIDAELSKTAESVRRGVPPAELYAGRVAENLNVPPPPLLDSDLVPDDLFDTSIWRVPVAGAPARGPADAPVTIVEFADFQCPFCAMAEKTLALLLEKYPGKLRLVFRHFPMPFHQYAESAAELALEARAQRGDAGFFEAARGLSRAQNDLRREALVAVARDLKLDVRKVERAIDRQAHRAVIEADQNLAESLEVEGIPQFFINGRRLVGAQPMVRFEEVILERLSDAERLMKESNTAPLAVYDEIMKSARMPLEPERKEIGLPPATSPSRGPVGAPLVLQVFSDFECPFCKELALLLERLRREYPEELRIVWRHLPLPNHPYAKIAAMAALEAQAQLGDEGFWKMHDLVYTGLARPNGEPNPATLERYAGRLGLDVDRFRAALEDGRHESAIARDIVTALASGIMGTPSVVLNGYTTSGLQPLRYWRRLVDRVLKESSAKRAP